MLSKSDTGSSKPEAKSGKKADKANKKPNADKSAKASKPADKAKAAAAAVSSNTSVKKQKSKPKHAKPKHGQAMQFSWKTAVLVISALVLAAIIFTMIYVAVIIHNTPKINADNIYTMLDQSTKIYDSNKKKIETVFIGENRVNVKYKRIPKDLVNAFVALEDKTFWKHHGFNVIRIFGAIKDKIFSGGSVSGTSTITQQLARNVFLKDRMTEHSMKRKIQEAWYAIQLEHSLSKEEIMEAYLNTVYLGFNSNGVASASEAYFSKSVKDLNLSQCALLASLVQSPTLLAPVQIYDSGAVHKDTKGVLKTTSLGTFVLSDASKSRRKICLDLMLEQGYIGKDRHDVAVKRSIKKIVKPSYNAINDKSSYFTDYVVTKVISDLEQKLGMSHEDAYNKVYRGGLKIITTQNSKVQKMVENAFKSNDPYPRPTGIIYDSDRNMLNKRGQLIMYMRENFIKGGKLVLPRNEARIRKDGSMVIYAGKRLKIYKTESNGVIDFALELPTMYDYEYGQLYSINGGIIAIPQKYKTRTSKGHIVISKEYMKTKDVRKMIKKNSNGGVTFSKRIYTLNQRMIQPQSAMTIIENKTGHVIALVGGRRSSGRMLYNRAIENRQPGSSIKPLAVYSAALQQSAEEAAKGKQHTFVNYNIDRQGITGWGSYITASSYVADERTVINGNVWPKNAGGGYSGRNTLRTAIKNSINTCAVKILYQVGINYSADLLKKYGITSVVTKGAVSDMNYAALALGGMTKGVSTLEMANAYTAFPNNGTKTEEPICYTEVRDSNGEVILDSKDVGRVRVIDPAVAWIMTDLMKGVVTGGTGTAASISGVQVAGKTGTTSDEYDLWFDGFTPKYTASLWMGNDINIKLSGMSSYAAGLWSKIMSQVPGVRSGSYKAMPSDVVRIGGEYYAKGTEVGRSTYYWTVGQSIKRDKKSKGKSKAAAKSSKKGD